jgi:hypothetical protein
MKLDTYTVFKSKPLSGPFAGRSVLIVDAHLHADIEVLKSTTPVMRGNDMVFQDDIDGKERLVCQDFKRHCRESEQAIYVPNILSGGYEVFIVSGAI